LSLVSDRQHITAQKIFTGDRWVLDAELVLQHGKVLEVRSSTQSPRYQVVVPAFIDLQIYGAHGKLLSAYPDVESLSLLYQYCREGGAAHFLPTIATNTDQVVSASIEAVRKYWQQGGKGCLGLHLEGPWIHPEKRGAHLASFIRQPDHQKVEALLNEGEGVISMITLAPEICDSELISLITERGIRVSAGHTHATYQEAIRAFDAGVSLVTHLYNAMSPLQHRSPGMVGAIFCSEHVMASIIPDGIHVDWAALQIAKKQLGDRLFAITDAVTETHEGPYQHQAADNRYESSGVLSGSSLTMLKALNNLIKMGAIEPAEALRMCSLYPARALGLDNRLGKLEPGYEAHWTALRWQDEHYTIENC
jgi:N-acetylglucosamine-6-phosphate deacetylase